MSRLRRNRAAQGSLVIALALVAAIGAAVRSDASTPPSDAVTVPAKAGQTVTVSWTGTIPAASAHPTNTCNGAGTPGQDEHAIQLTEPKKGYARLSATFTFRISWTPSSGQEDTNDEILTVNRAGAADEGDTEGGEVGSSDGSDVSETVVAHDLGGGQYSVLACGFVNTTPQPYTGTLTITTESQNAESSLRSVNAQGLAFSAAVPADPQRDEAEPLIEISPDGHVYTCGPTGFSSGVDYAQVSTDHGDQFHILGTQPRGQQGAGGGGDCSMATGQEKNDQGHYQYAYSGLGALSGFATATSPNDGHSLATAGADVNGGVTTQGVLADRQWEVFTDATTALLSWNQQEPRNTVVVKSTDGGLTFSPVAAVAAPNPEFPGPMRYIASSHTVFMPWTKGEQVNLAISQDGGDTWTNCKVASGDTVKGGTAGFAVADADSAGNVYVVWADSDRYHVWMSTLAADKVAGCDEPVDQVAADKTTNGQPSVDPGFTTPVQVDRDDVRTVVFPWVAAGGAPGRVAVAFYGTPSDGDPNSGDFDAAWDVYVNQSLDGGRSFSQVKATTHPFHYDSICLNGLGCDLAVPPGDRTLADFFAIGYSKDDGRLYVVFNRTNKKPDEDLGHIATPMVVSQVAGPSNGGDTVSVDGRDPVRSATTDAGGDALSSYSLTAPGVAPPAPPTQNEPAADFRSVTISPDAASGGFTVTMKLADLSQTALTQTLLHTGGQSIEWIWRFANGYQDVAASAAWSPLGWTFGFDDYTLGGTPCESLASAQGEKCQIYPQKTALQGKVDQLAGTITLVVPRSLLRQLSGADAAGRPQETAADTGARFYDGTAFSLVNTTSTTQAQQSFLYTLDNTPAMDFLLPAAKAKTSAGVVDKAAGAVESTTQTVEKTLDTVLPRK